MAYRKLKDTDLVRIVDKTHNHGRNGVVLDTGPTMAYVQICIGDDCECKWIPNKHLLIRDDGFVKDGQVDHEAKRLYDEQRSQRFKGRNNFDADYVEFDDEEECEYDGWDRDDLIERIKELEERHCECRFVK